MESMTDSDVKTFETIARRSAERHDLWARVSDADLKIAIGVFLLQHKTDGLVNVNEKAPWTGRRLFVMRQSACATNIVLIELGTSLWVIAMKMCLKTHI